MASAGIQGIFFGLDASTLETMKTNYIACLNAIAVAGASYTIANRQFTRANLGDVRQTLAEIQAALTRANGTSTTQTFGNFSS
jgi:hypothetical protein